jgi:subtilisin family serine protease
MKRFCRGSVIRGILLVLLAGLLLPALGLPQQEEVDPRNAKPEDKTDSLRAKQQALFDRLNGAEAWTITKGDPKVLVGVIDNGFDFFHPNLKGQLKPGYYYPGGYHTEFYEGIAHGTLVSSIIVAKENHPGGMVGLAPGCKVLTASQGMIDHTLYKLEQKFFQEHPSASQADFQKEFFKHLKEVTEFGRNWAEYQAANAADAIRYLVDHGVRVINFSGGLRKGFCQSAEIWRKVEEAFAYAASKNVVIVLAAGNSAERWEDYPGDPEAMIVAGASRLNDTRWVQEVSLRGTKMKQGSCYGKRLTVMAPVENLVVCVPHERRVYETHDGPMGATTVPYKGDHEVVPIGATSSAAPIVSSLAALIYSVRPELDARSVVAIIKKGCDQIGEKGHDLYTGYGRVNFGNSVKLARDWGK